MSKNENLSKDLLPEKQLMGDGGDRGDGSGGVLPNGVTKIAVGVSSCLLGDRVRFDGGHKSHSYITNTLGQYFAFTSYCPEVAIGLGTPRETIRLIHSEKDDAESIAVKDSQKQAIPIEVKCVGTKTASLDVTQPLKAYANSEQQSHRSLYGYIVKKGSPSCGMERVRIYHSGKDLAPTTSGRGIYTQQLMQNFPNLPVEEEGRLGDPVLRENFIHRVFIYFRLKALQSSGLSWAKLTEFHARHKLILFSHDQNRARALGSVLSSAHNREIKDYFIDYESEFMSLLSVPASRANHVNVLEHIRGYLKQELDKGDKQELTESILAYRMAQVPLIVPVTLLRHYFRKHPHDYINQSYYLHPHPAELMLLNSL